MSLTEVMEAVRALSAEERAQIKSLIDSLPSSSEPLMTEDEYARHLAAKGIITLPEPMTDEELAQEMADEETWEPVEVQGTPLSRMIIEERR